VVCPPGTNLDCLKPWLPKEPLEDLVSEEASRVEPQKGIALSDLLARIQGVIDRGMAAAVWVRAEISEVREKNGHLYLELPERN
jgi:hypothetical protein